MFFSLISLTDTFPFSWSLQKRFVRPSFYCARSKDLFRLQNESTALKNLPVFDPLFFSKKVPIFLCIFFSGTHSWFVAILNGDKKLRTYIVCPRVSEWLLLKTGFWDRQLWHRKPFPRLNLLEVLVKWASKFEKREIDKRLSSFFLISGWLAEFALAADGSHIFPAICN